MSSTTNLDKLKINYLTQAQYNSASENNQINENELYFTPGQDQDTSMDTIENLIEEKIPENVSAFINDAGYLVSHQDISGKQDTLVSGTNIKTINNESILGSGNITVNVSIPVATTSTNGLMSSTDKIAVDKIGTGTLNTTNKTLIPAVNELLTKVSNFTITSTNGTASPSGRSSTVTNYHILKINNLVMIDILLVTDTSSYTNLTLWTVPSGYRPKATVYPFRFAMQVLSGGYVTAQSSWPPFTINSSGAFVIGTSGSGFSRASFMMTFVYEAA